MATIELSYETMRAKYPDHVAKVMAKLEAGKSKEKGRPPEDLKWAIGWCAQVGRVLSEEDRQGTPGAAPEDIRARIRCSFEGKVGRWRGQSSPSEFPQELLDYFTASEEEEAARQKENDALTDEEREQRAEEALQQLRGTPGFVELRVPASNPLATLFGFGSDV